MNMHSDHLFDPTLTFDIIPIKDLWKGKLVIKGAESVHDVEMACKLGVDGVIISNHGGRQLDGALSSIRSLPSIIDAVGDQIEVWMDGGIRSGQDILKCLALGANAVQVGRPILWGLGYDGQIGVELVLNLLIKELVEIMILTGCKNLSEITSDLVTKS